MEGTFPPSSWTTVLARKTVFKRRLQICFDDFQSTLGNMLRLIPNVITNKRGL